LAVTVSRDRTEVTLPDRFEHNDQVIQVRSFKWPRRPTSTAITRLIGEDEFGRWLGVAKGNSWWPADRSRSGVFESSFVKVVPLGTYWTACFNLVDPIIDVDVVLPVQWVDGALEEVDLELDVLGYANGSVEVRDKEEFSRVRVDWQMPDSIARQAEETCERIREIVKLGDEPFGSIGRSWLERFCYP
jgi:uncharacterized protein